LNPRDYPSQSKTRENGPSSSCIQNRRDNTKIKRLKEKGFVHANVQHHFQQKNEKNLATTKTFESNIIVELASF